MLFADAADIADAADAADVADAAAAAAPAPAAAPAAPAAPAAINFLLAEIFGLLFAVFFVVEVLLLPFFETGYKGFLFKGFLTFLARNLASRFVFFTFELFELVWASDDFSLSSSLFSRDLAFCTNISCLCINVNRLTPPAPSLLLDDEV